MQCLHILLKRCGSTVAKECKNYKMHMTQHRNYGAQHMTCRQKYYIFIVATNEEFVPSFELKDPRCLGGPPLRPGQALDSYFH